MNELKITEFPKTRYYGSKRQHLSWIHAITKNIEFETVLDVFGGTASVSLLFLKMGKKVTYNDNLKFNAISADAILNKPNTNIIEECCELIKDVVPYAGFVSNTFNGMYYTDEENMYIDGFSRFIEKINGPHKKVLYYGFFQACLSKRPYNLFHRANLNMRLKDTDRSFGNLTAWNKSFEKWITHNLREFAKLDISGKCEIKCQDALDLENNHDLVYLDPPYISNTKYTESYLSRYHFLEGIVNFDVWNDLIDHNTKTKKFKDNYPENTWNNKSKTKEKLFELIAKHQKSKIVFSYCDKACPSSEEIIEFMNSIFNTVDIHYKNSRHSLSKKDRNELIFIGR
ncbi:DNA adenine methylase [Nitrincola iocasae]|uniref:DNA adenine methylase n=1 Tax=Nitrincola iocasae TaxID=2614693 RepID=UPI001782492E|nr:DNA adenine methylase [Nitrincola iocasae]